MNLIFKLNQRIGNTIFFDVYYAQYVDGVYSSYLCGTIAANKDNNEFTCAVYAFAGFDPKPYLNNLVEQIKQLLEML